MNKDHKGLKLIIISVIIAFVIFLSFTLYSIFFKSSEEQAKEAVELFYDYEQEGAFSESWAMFHPFMMEKFSKGHYLQDRAHVFMNHFGVTSFDYYVEEPEEITNWEMEEGAEVIPKAYKVSVSQIFKGKYGNFTITQDVYATEVDGEWTILWDYMK